MATSKSESENAVESPSGANTVAADVKAPVEAVKTESGKKYYDDQGVLQNVSDLEKEEPRGESIEAKATADGKNYYDSQGKLQSVEGLSAGRLDPAVVGF